MKNNVVGDNIRVCRERKGWTKERLALEGGISIATVSRVENGLQNYTEATLKKITSALGLRLSDLFVATEEDIQMIPVYRACPTCENPWLCPLINPPETDEYHPGPVIKDHRLFYLISNERLSGGRIQKDDRLLIDQDARIKSSDLVLIRSTETPCSLKRVYFFHDQVFLQAAPGPEPCSPELIELSEWEKYHKAKIIQASMSFF